MEVIDELISLRFNAAMYWRTKKVNEDQGLNDIGGEFESSKER